MKPEHIEERKLKRCPDCGAVLRYDGSCPRCDAVDGQEANR